jgi:murein L,D-transpeptidase YafK
MNRKLFLTFCLCLPLLLSAQGFQQEQKKAKRVKAAYTEKFTNLKADLLKKNVSIGSMEILIRAFKEEGKTELWCRNKGKGEFILFRTYDICASSGDVGPKRKQGDGQVPEGYYHVSVFNPYSSYHLSLGINYPNASDKIIGKGNLGGDIMIHGSCVTIGCIPLTDNYIKEVYVLAVEARNGGQTTIPVHIYPCRPEGSQWSALKEKHSSDKTLTAFWDNIKEGYDIFMKSKKLPVYSVDKNGRYVFAR